MMSGHYTNYKNAPLYSSTLGPSGAPVGGNTQSVGDATGFDTVRTPKDMATVSVAYSVPAPRGSLRFVVSDYYNSGFRWDPDNRLRHSCAPAPPRTYGMTLSANFYVAARHHFSSLGRAGVRYDLRCGRGTRNISEAYVSAIHSVIAASQIVNQH
jgi:hypothetical protein